MYNSKLYFDHHPTVDIFYFTDDGQAFYTDADAQGHARSLRANGGKDTVTPVIRAHTPDAPAAGPKDRGHKKESRQAGRRQSMTSIAAGTMNDFTDF